MPGPGVAPKTSRTPPAFPARPAARAEWVNPRSPGNNQLLDFTSPSLTADGPHPSNPRHRNFRTISFTYVTRV
jgi:hypothetical protein